MIDVQTRPIFLEGPGETFNWIFCGLYLYVSISQLLKNSLWLGLKLLKSFFNYVDQIVHHLYLPPIDIGKGFPVQL